MLHAVHLHVRGRAELFKQTEHDEPKYFVRLIDVSSNTTDFDVTSTVSHELCARRLA